MGLIVLQADETLEGDMRVLLSDAPGPVYVSRIPSAPMVTPETLTDMADDLQHAAALLPDARPYGVIGYGCTSASAVIGSDKVAQIVKSGAPVAEVTNPLRATIACAAHHGISRLALISPYIESVNAPLRTAFAAAGVSTEVFGSFGIAEEAKVVRITADSLLEAGRKLGADPAVEGVFLSCTNLRTLPVLDRLAKELGKPVMSSNQALGWHMKRLNAA